MSGFPFSLGKFQIRTCPDFHLSMKNFKSGHVRISISDTSGFWFLNWEIPNPDASGIQFRTRPDFNFSIEKFQIRTRPDFNSGLQILMWHGPDFQTLVRILTFLGKIVQIWSGFGSKVQIFINLRKKQYEITFLCV